MPTSLGTVFRALLAAICLLAADTGACQDAQPLSWLKSADYAALEQFYSRQQADYESGQTTDQALYDRFRLLYEDAQTNERYFDQWVQSYPASYPARLARGAYLYRMAWFSRGERTIPETPRSQLTAMREYLERAKPDLLASLKMTAKPYLSALYLLNVTILRGSSAEHRQWFELGSAIDPRNTLVRLRYMSSLLPRWGGSYSQMQAFLGRCQQEHLDPKLLARLEMLIHADRAETAGRDETQQLDQWGQVLELARIAGVTPSTEALIGYSRAAWDLNRRADAEHGLQQLSGRKLNDAWSLTQVGWLFAQDNRDAEAWPLLLQAAALNDPWAQFTVGRTTYFGEPSIPVEADRSAALAWIKRAAGQCYPQAREFLSSLGYPRRWECDLRSLEHGYVPQVAAPVLQWVVWGVLMSLFMRWMARSRTRARPPDQMRHLQHPPSAMVVSVVALVLIAAFDIFLVVANDAGLIIPIAVGLFGVLPLVLIAQYRFERYELTADGMDYGRLTGARGTLKWNQVTRVTYSPSMKWFRIETLSGDVVRVSVLLMGLPEFARELLAQVPRTVVDDKTYRVLETTAQGELPRVMG